ncbi:hypothetical protein HMPREF9194_01611 [Treponema maltophilum ATCC 51939]|uniref:Uncharacterized protein n=2 Tax=Treponema maltophilum TaxID=51160 RepID=S3JZ53_TREMA|nr:hypothetical protein HMPREF9194_01611 [Treponema maltophilum ATCC 51939]
MAYERSELPELSLFFTPYRLYAVFFARMCYTFRMNVYVKSCRSIKAQHIPAASSAFSASARRSVAAAPILVLFALFFFFGCTRARTSSLMLAVGSEDGRGRSQNGGAAGRDGTIVQAGAGASAAVFLPLDALNANARSARIGEGAKSPYMFFAFTAGAGSNGKQAAFARKGCALELELIVHAAEALSRNGENGEPCFIAFLYADDFSSSRSLKKNLTGRSGVKAFIKKNVHFKVSLGFEGGGTFPDPESVKGFMIYSAVPVELKSAAVTKAYCGWAAEGTMCRFGFSANGGTVDSALLNEGKIPEQTLFSQVPVLLQDGARAVRIMLRTQSEAEPSVSAASALSASDVRIACASDTLRIRRSPAIRSVSIDERSLSSACDSVKIISGADSVEGILLEQRVSDAFTPITADPGLITAWPQKRWRNKNFEFFSWEQFPSVLIFDFVDYNVQNAFLKRLAFFVEKKGFIGKLLTDAQMASSHGFNAHDYRAESLAAFFDKAEKEHFALNESELLLRDILFANGVILRSASGITAGRGAVVSISRESPRFLRERLLVHEGLHGVYFTEESFRREVDEVFYATDPVSLRFLKRYFEVNPSLNYNTDDSYLFKNEFMAYTLQQSVGEVKNYYIDRLARIINSAEPELCAYIRDTEAAAFTQAAEKMSAFLAENWGINGGRISLISFE